MNVRERRVWRKRLFTFTLAALLALLLGACQTNEGPSAEELAAARESLVEAAGFKQDESLRVRFQPPIGNAKPVKGELEDNANLELVVFNLDPASGHAYGSALSPTMSTAEQTVSVANHVYSATWDVASTAAVSDGDYVRVEIRPAGVPQEQACNEPWGACLGYFDARIVRTGKPHAAVPDEPALVTAEPTTAVPAEAQLASPTGKKLKNVVTVPDHAQLPVKFKLLAGTQELPDPSLGVAGLVALSGQGDKLDTAGNCSANDFTRPGQGLQAVGAGLQAVGAGLQAVGAVGGLFVADAQRLADPSVAGVTSNDEVAAQLLEHLDPSPYGPRPPVAIMVVDSFNGSYGLPQRLLDVTALSVGELDALVADGSLSHGALVFHQLKELASAATGDDTPWPDRPGARVALYNFGGTHYGTPLLLETVDATDLNTDELADKIRAAIAHVSRVGFKHVVVNMSFAIVPCAVAGDVANTVGTSAIPTFEAYVASLLQVNAISPQHLEELGALASEPLALESDSFFRYLDCPLPATYFGQARCDGKTPWGPVVWSLVHVAAAGNYGNDYALYPAALPNVISVGALDVAGSGYADRRSSFSNAATVLAPGALFDLAAKQGGQRLVYAGTSFAAPVVSLFSALDTMLGTRLCDAGSLNRSPLVPPDLALDDLLGRPLLPAFYGPAPDAVGTLCGISD